MGALILVGVAANLCCGWSVYGLETIYLSWAFQFFLMTGADTLYVIYTEQNIHAREHGADAVTNETLTALITHMVLP